MSWTPPCETDHQRWTLDVWYLLAFDGRIVRAQFDAGIPSSDIAQQGARLAAKFDALAEPVLGAARARELRSAIDGLDAAADIGAVARLAAK